MKCPLTPTPYSWRSIPRFAFEMSPFLGFLKCTIKKKNKKNNSNKSCLKKTKSVLSALPGMLISMTFPPYFWALSGKKEQSKNTLNLKLRDITVREQEKRNHFRMRRFAPLAVFSQNYLDRVRKHSKEDSMLSIYSWVSPGRNFAGEDTASSTVLGM